MSGSRVETETSRFRARGQMSPACTAPTAKFPALLVRQPPHRDHLGARLLLEEAVHGRVVDHEVQVPHEQREAPGGLGSHGVALQVAFERHILKPVFHLIDFRLWV
jgi:hypothetical protein